MRFDAEIALEGGGMFVEKLMLGMGLGGNASACLVFRVLRGWFML